MRSSSQIPVSLWQRKPTTEGSNTDGHTPSAPMSWSMANSESRAAGALSDF